MDIKAYTIGWTRVKPWKNYIANTKFFDIVGHCGLDVYRHGGGCEVGLIAIDIYTGVKWLYLKIVQVWSSEHTIAIDRARISYWNCQGAPYASWICASCIC